MKKYWENSKKERSLGLWSFFNIVIKEHTQMHLLTSSKMGVPTFHIFPRNIKINFPSLKNKGERNKEKKSTFTYGIIVISKKKKVNIDENPSPQ